MTARTIRNALMGLVLILIPAGVAAQQSLGDLAAYLPPVGELAGWSLVEAPQNYRGEELFRMIDGGADIYHEYGFKQILAAEYLDQAGKPIKLEIYEMQSPAAAFGIYTFKIGQGGKELKIGQEACLQDYYLNFWKGDLLVTIVGPDPEEKTIQSVLDLAKAVEARIPETGQRPDLTESLLRQPLAFSQPRYIRGPLGLMASYIFDTKNIFRVSEGVIGKVKDCRAFVFRYADDKQSAEVFTQAVAGFDAGSKFTDKTLAGDQYSMVDRESDFILINRKGRYLTVVMGPEKIGVRSIAGRLADKINKP